MQSNAALPPIQRPRAETFAIEDLIEEVKVGRMRIPTFQRAFEWSSRDIVSLFDSIYRGYPIGDLLLAQMPGKAQDLVFGPVRLQAEVRQDAWYIVDGQQRINALAGALLHPKAAPCADRHAIWFDLEAGEFVRLTTRDTPPAWVPVNVLIDQAKLLHWVNQWALRSERPDLVARSFELSKTLGKYRVPVYILNGADDRTLREVFRRANTAGRPLKESEVFEALSGVAGDRPVDEACARLADLGFGTLTPDWFVKTVRVVAAAARSANRQTQAPNSAEVIDTERALARVFRFMVDVAEVPHLNLLPYRRPILVLARLFHLYPELNVRDQERLKRWLWRGNLSGEHEGTNNAVIKRACAGFDRGPTEAVDHLVRGVTSSVPHFDLDAPWSNAGTAASSTFALALWHLRPCAADVRPGAPSVGGGTHQTRDFAYGATMEPSADAWSALRETVASPFAPKGSTPLAERLLICGPHGEALTRSEWMNACSALAASSPEVWASHGLDARAAAALRARDREAFIKARRAHLETRLPEIFCRLAGVGLSDRPSMASLVQRAATAVHASLSITPVPGNLSAAP